MSYSHAASAESLALDARLFGVSVVSEIPINRHECFRADITMRNGKPIVALSRWKTPLAGTPRRTGQAFEFGAQRLAAVAKLLAEAEMALDSIASQKEAVNERAS
jgi:hypothetical protein